MTVDQYGNKLTEAQTNVRKISDGTFRQQQLELACNRDFFWMRAWALETIASGRTLNHCYRKFELNPEDDISAACGLYGLCLPTEPELRRIAKAMQQHELRYFWRYLLGRHAHQSARAVGDAFERLGEPWYWGIWRAKDLLYPRLLLGVFAGYLLIYTSSELWGFLTFLERHWLRDWLRAASLLATLVLAFMEVQRRVGRLEVRVILRRTWTLTWVSFVYGALVAGMQFQMGEWLGGWHGGSYAHGGSIAVNAMFLAVMLGMVTQSFGREESLGEPL